MSMTILFMNFFINGLPNCRHALLICGHNTFSELKKEFTTFEKLLHENNVCIAVSHYNSVQLRLSNCSATAEDAKLK